MDLNMRVTYARLKWLSERYFVEDRPFKEEAEPA
jgi:hypothetical protein